MAFSLFVDGDHLGIFNASLPQEIELGALGFSQRLFVTGRLRRRI